MIAHCLPCVGLISVGFWVSEGGKDGLSVLVHEVEPVPGGLGVVLAVQPPRLLHAQVPLEVQEEVVARHRPALKYIEEKK